jgi:hypothetical protein
MTVINPRKRSLSFWSGAIGLGMLLALAGCKSGNSDNSSRNGDPLVSGPSRIPAQNIPVPERGIGSNGKLPDPLLGGPSGKPQDRTGVGYTDDPSRFKGSYIPSPNSTPAALAGHMKDGEELKIDGSENRIALQQASAVLPSKATMEQGVSPALSAIYQELEKYGCKSEDRSIAQENGEYVFRASVPREGGVGAKLLVSGIGRTPEEAAKQALDQIQLDRR